MSGHIQQLVASGAKLQRVRHDFELDSVSLYGIVGNNLLFIVREFNTCYLWKTDGTPGGTSQIISLPGLVQSVVSFNGKVYMGISTNNYNALWETDGTAGGTTLVRLFDYDVNHYNQPRNLKAFNNRLYFTANTHAAGVELWSSDGTAGGTTIVKDIFPGYRSSVPREFIDIPNGKFMFVADDGFHGQELWITDGTDTGTHNYAQTMIGCASLRPHFLNYVNGHAVFYGAHDMYGYEPFSIDPFQVLSVENTVKSTPLGSLHVYPNPARGTLNILVEDGSEYSVFSINGARMMDGVIPEGVANLQLNVAGLSPGMYFVQVTNKFGKRQFAKWLKD